MIVIYLAAKYSRTIAVASSLLIAGRRPPMSRATSCPLVQRATVSAPLKGLQLLALGSLVMALRQLQLRLANPAASNHFAVTAARVPAAYTAWRQDNLDGLGLGDITNGTLSTTLGRHTRLPTRSPCWWIRNASRCLPDFLVIGTMKAGTTALSSYLQFHEDVFMSTKKEPNFFSPRCGRHCPSGGHYHNLRFYMSLFPSLDARTAAGLRASAFEATSSYLFSSASTPALIHAWLPDAKLIVIVRDPVERAYSQYQLGFTLLREDSAKPADQRACDSSALGMRSFDELVRQALPLFERCVGFLVAGHDQSYYKCKRQALEGSPCDQVVTASSLINPGLYFYHIRRYLRHFRRDQILILDNAALANRPEESLREVFDFLGLAQPASTWVTPDVFQRVCPRFFGITAAKTYHAKATPDQLSTSAQQLMGRLGSGTKPCEEYTAMSAWARARLAVFYEPHNQRLFHLLGRNLSWG